MRKITIFIFTLIFILSSGGFLFAQDDMEEEPAYISYLVGNVDVDITPDNNIEDFEVAELDMDLPAGTIIRTGQDAICEITMPDESTIKISSGSVFQIEEVLISKETGRKVEKFNLIFGKVRAKVQKFTTSGSEFNIVSGTSLAGVRGTSYGVFFDGLKSHVLVFEGKVSLGSLTGAFGTVMLSQGQMSFIPKDGIPEPAIEIPEDVLKEWDKELGKFVKEVKEVTEPEEEKKVEKPEPKKPEKESFIEKFLKMNAYIGTVTMNDQVYSRWIFTPTFTFGKLGMGLFLPAVFAPDVGILGFKDWQNHGEWDFKDFKDGFHDFITKFYYISWGTSGDPLYFKIGSIDDFYLGHGFIVDNYSNMLYFPEERNVGLQLNIDKEYVGFETIVGDFSNFQLFGGRVYLRPMGKKIPLAFGLTGVHDKPKPDIAFLSGIT